MPRCGSGFFFFSILCLPAVRYFPKKESTQSSPKGSPLGYPRFYGGSRYSSFFLSTGTPLKKRVIICHARPLLRRLLTPPAFALGCLVLFFSAPKFAAPPVSGTDKGKECVAIQPLQRTLSSLYHILNIIPTTALAAMNAIGCSPFVALTRLVSTHSTTASTQPFQLIP